MHTFEFSEEWGQKLSAEAPQLGRKRVLVEENAKAVQDGFVMLKDGPPDQWEKILVPHPPPTTRISPPSVPVVADSAPLFANTCVTVALIDTLSASLALGDDAAALNFANAYSHGGGYKRGAQAQEEDLCRLLPQLIHSLEYVPYPIEERQGECLLTRDLSCVRQVGSYKFCHSQ